MLVIIVLLICRVSTEDSLDVGYLPKRKTPPSARIFSVMDYNPITESLHVFGGFANNEYLNDFWVFNLNSSIWQNTIAVSSDVPGIG